MNIQPLHTEDDYQQALARIDEIFDAKANTKKGDELEILGVLVDEYEENHFPIEAPRPVEAIKFRMDQLGMAQKDLAKILGSKSRASEILSGKRSLSLNQIKILEGFEKPTIFESVIASPEASGRSNFHFMTERRDCRTPFAMTLRVFQSPLLYKKLGIPAEVLIQEPEPAA